MEEDRKDIEATLAGDHEAYSHLVQRYQKPVYFTALRMLKNTEDADEVTQKTFLKAYRALAGFRFESSLKTWLTTIVMNLCRTELMKKKREMVELPETLADPSYQERRETEEADYQKTELKNALDSLPLRQREVVTLRIYQEMPFKEIAQALDSTETAVKVNFHHAMKSLKNWIGKKVQDDVL